MVWTAAAAVGPWDVSPRLCAISFARDVAIMLVRFSNACASGRRTTSCTVLGERSGQRTPLSIEHYKP
eukprot:3761000-Pleurochrysis_carterae.AAC.1